MTEKHSIKKTRYFVKGNRNRQYLEPGQRGFLATCNFREKDCIREAYNILNHYADKLYGSVTKPEKPTEVSSNESDDISEQLMTEITTAKTEYKGPQSKKRFQAVETGASNCLFISTSVHNPVELGTQIVQDISDTKKQETRFLIRLVPIEKVCRANMLDIVNSAGELFDKYFTKDPKTFSIVYNRRYNNSLNRDDIIKALADLVGQKNALNKADLKQAELCVVVEIIKGLCLISVVPDYFKFKKYNLLELSQSTNSENSLQSATKLAENQNDTVIGDATEVQIDTKTDIQSDTADDNKDE